MERCDGGNRACERIILMRESLTDDELVYHLENRGNYPFTDFEIDLLCIEYSRRTTSNL